MSQDWGVEQRLLESVEAGLLVRTPIKRWILFVNEINGRAIIDKSFMCGR